jgi:hypothetical protein
MVFFTFPEDARWNADRGEVEFGVEVASVMRHFREAGCRQIPDNGTLSRYRK